MEERRIGDLLWLTGTALLIWWVLGWVKPFGLDATTQSASERVLIRLMSPFHQNPRPGVTVVLIDDRYLETAGSGWPLPYAEQGRLLRNLLAYRPDSVFLDILYRHPHGEADLPEDLLRAAGARRVVRGVRTPLFIAALAPVTGEGDCTAAPPVYAAGTQAGSQGGNEGVLAEFADTAVWQRAYVNWRSCPNRYPLQLDTQGERLTPAAALLRAHCARERQSYSSATAPTDCEAVIRRLPQLFDETGGLPPMFVRWSADPSPAHESLYAPGTCQEPTPDGGWWRRQRARFDRLLTQGLRGLSGNIEQSSDPAVRLPCPAVDIVRAGSLDGTVRADLEPLLAGRIVLVGTYLEGLPDLYDSAVNGLVPGVVVHATALDNLLAANGAYLRKPSGIWKSFAEIAYLVGMAALMWLCNIHDLLKTRFSGYVNALVWATLAVAVAWKLDNRLLAVQLAGVAIVLDLFKPRLTAEVVMLGAVGLLIALLLRLGDYSGLNWISTTVALWATLEVARSVRHDMKKRQETQAISMIRSTLARWFPR